VAPFEGTWQVELLEINGQTVPEEELKRLQFVIKGNRMTVQTAGEVSITFRVHPYTKPMAMDLTVRLVRGGQVAQQMEGIAQVDADTLKLCWHNGEGIKQRPSEFAAPAESNCFFLTLRRVPR